MHLVGQQPEVVELAEQAESTRPLPWNRAPAIRSGSSYDRSEESTEDARAGCEVLPVPGKSP